MRRALSRAFARVSERNLTLARFSAVGGCIILALAVAGLVEKVRSGVAPEDIASTLNSANSFLLASLQFLFAALFALPEHRRNAKGWLRVAILLVSLAALTLATVVIAA